MDINPIYYVYAHLHDDGEPYYIGKGKDDRAYRLEDNSRVRILADCLTERTAFIYERILIKHYGRIDKGTGILHNKADGGEGSTGLVVSEAMKAKQRNSIKALNKEASYVSASCTACKRVITSAVESIAFNIRQHRHYKHKESLTDC